MADIPGREGERDGYELGMTSSSSKNCIGWGSSCKVQRPEKGGWLINGAANRSSGLLQNSV